MCMTLNLSATKRLQRSMTRKGGKMTAWKVFSVGMDIDKMTAYLAAPCMGTKALLEADGNFVSDRTDPKLTQDEKDDGAVSHGIHVMLNEQAAKDYAGSIQTNIVVPVEVDAADLIGTNWVWKENGANGNPVYHSTHAVFHKVKVDLTTVREKLTAVLNYWKEKKKQDLMTMAESYQTQANYSVDQAQRSLQTAADLRKKADEQKAAAKSLSYKSVSAVTLDVVKPNPKPQTYAELKAAYNSSNKS